MIRICTLGGFCFLALGFFSSIEFFSFGLTSGTITLDNARLILPPLLALGIAVVSVLSSFNFTRFSNAWDVRESEISLAEHVLTDTLEGYSR